MSQATTVDWRRIGKGVLVVVLLVLAGLFIARIPRTFAIILTAALIAFGAEPIVTRLTRRIPKVAAISVVFAGLTLLIVVGLIVVVPVTIEQTKALGAGMPGYVTAFQHWITGLELSVQHLLGLRVHPQTFDLGQIGSARIDALFTTSIAAVQTVLINTGTAFFILFSAIVLSFLFLMNDTKIADTFVSLFPASRRDAARKLSAEISDTFGSYISGQVAVSAITALIVAGLAAIAGFKLPWILLIITFIGYSIPMIGMVLAQLTAAVLCAPQGVWMIVWVQLIMFGVGRISDNVLVPKIMGQSVGISPIGIMLAVFAGGELFGLPGLLLAIPLAALLKILWRYFGPQLQRAD